MNYKETLTYLFSQLPMFQRIGAAAYKANLDNTISLMSMLDSPEKKFKSIHIAGTNGKGSTSHMLAAIFQEAGYKTGLYTSPHLLDFRERIRINGKMIPKKEVVNFVTLYKPVFDEIQPSFFEWTVALAYDYFSRKQVDIAIIETGLGGRLDSTNVIQPELSIITNISFDHTQLLGETLDLIATEKSGIIKTGIPILIGEKNEQTTPVFRDKAIQQNSPIFYTQDLVKIRDKKQEFKNGKLYLNFRVNRSEKKMSCDLPGLYQTKNIATVLAACGIINSTSTYELSATHVKKALKNIQGLTGLMGRWHILSKKPLIIADTGHNEDGIKEVLKNLKNTNYKKLHFILGMVNDKDIRKILSLLPKKASYYFCKASIPRALDEKLLEEQAKTFFLKGNSFATVADAIKKATKKAAKEDLIFIGGSTFTVADALAFFRK